MENKIYQLKIPLPIHPTLVSTNIIILYKKETKDTFFENLAWIAGYLKYDIL